MLIRRPADIGNLVKAARIAKGLSQQEFADRLGASRLWVGEFEGGKPSARLELVLRALNELEIKLIAQSKNSHPENKPSIVRKPLIDIDAIADSNLPRTVRSGARSSRRQKR